MKRKRGEEEDGREGRRKRGIWEGGRIEGEWREGRVMMSDGCCAVSVMNVKLLL